MKQLVSLILSTRRFRYTMTVLLVFGALFAVSQSPSQESGAAAKGDTEAVTEGDVRDNGSESLADEAAPRKGEVLGPAVSSENVTDEILKNKAQRFLNGLSENVSSKAVPEAIQLSDEIIGLAYKGEEKEDSKKDLRSQVSDKEGAGKLIHDLRMRGFVPVKSIRWINPVADKKEEADEEKAAEDAKKPKPDAVLWGVITVEDKRNPDLKDWVPRSRAIKITFKKLGDDYLIRELKRPSARELGGVTLVQNFIKQVQSGQVDQAWMSGTKELKAARSAEELLVYMDGLGFLGSKSVKWGKETAIEGGFKLNGLLELEGGGTLAFYVALLETKEGLKVLDFQSMDSFIGRIFGGRGDTLDMVLAVVALALVLVFLYIIASYVRGLWGSPRELYILFFTKLTEYSAYGAAQLSFMFYLREDLRLGDIGAGTYYSTWSTIVTATTMIVGAVCDTIGVKKTLIIGSILLLISRIVMPFCDNIWVVSLLGFIPLGIGVAITGPVLSVGIKRFTTIEGAALGFGLFYTLMNVGWAIGAKLFDVVRISMGEMGRVEFLGDSLSTWQVLFGIGFFINLPDLLAILWMRDGVEMSENGVKFPDKKLSADRGDDTSSGSLLARSMASMGEAAAGTVKVFRENFVQRAFWIFILLIGITVFTRLTFFHFHITWPTYGIRYFGQGSLVGNVFGVLNPVIIIFLVPVVAYLTRKVRSYWLLLVGTIISVASVFFVVIPPEAFAVLTDTWFGIVVFERWLEVPVGNRDPYYLSMVLFVIVFSIGEAIWSPRLMQFTAEIAPPGREGSYISLAYLPYFASKFIVGPMAGMLLAGYAPEFGVDGIYGYYPDHQMIWWWIGGTALLTPLGLVAFRKLYHIAETCAEETAKEAAGDERSE